MIFVFQLSPAPIKVELAAVTVKVGQSVQASAKVTIPSPYHAYQNPPFSEFENPLKLVGTSKAITLNQFVYPPGLAKVIAGGESRIYEGVVTVKFRVTAPKSAKPGVIRIPVRVEYQLCTATTCLPPTSLTTSLSVRVTK
ncbi:MAG: hypothetical protein C4320_08010 [Armatimonadota bacterium]